MHAHLSQFIKSAGSLNNKSLIKHKTMTQGNDLRYSIEVPFVAFVNQHVFKLVRF